MPTHPTHNRDLAQWQAGLMLFWLALLTFVAVSAITPPVARTANAPEDQFSAVRALVPLREIARLPHPQGASEQSRIREYLLAQLRLLGTTPHLQTTPVVSARNHSPYRAGTVHNIWAKIPGQNPTGTLLLAAHYDSVNTGPGASDDGASVAALLETLRALQSTHKAASNHPISALQLPSGKFNFRNDIIVLLTDGEETGLLGARAFVENLQKTGTHPTPVLVLNFEARGTSGPSLMFETSDGNGWLARQFATATPQPLGSSLFYAVYKLLPNDTDFTEFREAGMIGLNFAYLDRVAHYHTSLDDIAHLDLRSLQHQGDNMLGLARQFGNEPLGEARQPDVIYFNGLRNWLCVYPQTWAVPLALLATMLAFVVMAQEWRQSEARSGRKVIGFLRGVAWVGLAIVVTVIAFAGLSYWLTSGSPTPRMTLYLDGTTLAGVLLLCVGGVLLLLDTERARPTSRKEAANEKGAEAGVEAEISATNANENVANHQRRRDKQAKQEYTSAGLPLSLTPDAIQSGAIVWWLILAWLTAILLPDGSYLFVWPLLGVLAARWIQGIYLQKRQETPQGFGFTLVYQMLGAIPAIFLVVPVLCLLFQTLSIGSLTIVGALTALTIALLRPQFRVGIDIFPGHAQALPLLLAVCGMILLWVGAEVLQPSEAHPRSDSLFYALDADTGKAIWASSDSKPDAWTKQFLGEHPERRGLTEFLPVSRETFLHAPAPTTPLTPPTAIVQEDRVENGVRSLCLHIASPRHAPLLEIAVSPDVRVLSAAIEDKPIDGSRDPIHAWSLLYFNAPENGLILTLRVSPAAPFTLHLIDRSYGLPTIPDKIYTPRPPEIIASPSSGWYQDTTFIAKTVRIP